MPNFIERDNELSVLSSINSRIFFKGAKTALLKKIFVPKERATPTERGGKYSEDGEIYPYFVCSNRVRKANNCQHKATLIYEVEQKIIKLYDQFTISEIKKEQLKNG